MGDAEPNWTRHAVRITGDGREHGSGFVLAVARDSGAPPGVVVTAAHVVDDLGGSAGLRVNGRAVRGIETLLHADVALLEVDGPLDAVPLPVASGATRGRAIVAVGWGAVEDGGVAEVCRGTVEELTSLTYKDSAVPFDGLRLALARPIRRGYSGGPVIDVATGGVIGVLTMREGDRAHATSSDAIVALHSRLERIQLGDPLDQPLREFRARMLMTGPRGMRGLHHELGFWIERHRSSFTPAQFAEASELARQIGSMVETTLATGGKAPAHLDDHEVTTHHASRVPWLLLALAVVAAVIAAIVYALLTAP